MKRIYKTPFVGDMDTEIAIGDQPLEVVGVHEDGSLLVATDEDLAEGHHFERQPDGPSVDAPRPAKKSAKGKPARGKKSSEPSAEDAGDDAADSIDTE